MLFSLDSLFVDDALVLFASQIVGKRARSGKGSRHIAVRLEARGCRRRRTKADFKKARRWVSERGIEAPPMPQC